MRLLGAVVAPDADRSTRRMLEAKAEQLTHESWAADAARSVVVTGYVAVSAAAAVGAGISMSIAQAIVG
jgi:hypothetical protein